MSTKSEQLQIRLTPGEKRRLKKLAKGAGLDVSSYVLRRALPAVRLRVEELVGRLARGDDRRFVLAELSDTLFAMTASQIVDLEHLDVSSLAPLEQNYVAAMVEQTANRAQVGAPRWTTGVVPLDEPYFTTSLKSLRLHLLRASPVAFKRRNIFVDSSVGDRV